MRQLKVGVADHSAKRERDKISTSLPHWLKSKEAGCQTTQSLHHVATLVVIVMCLMLKCMQTSKVEIQINNQIWSSCFWRFVILVMLILVGHFVTHFDIFISFFGQVFLFSVFSARFHSIQRSPNPRLSSHAQRGGTILGVFVPIWLVLPRCEATNLGVFDLSRKGFCRNPRGIFPNEF